MNARDGLSGEARELSEVLRISATSGAATTSGLPTKAESLVKAAEGAAGADNDIYNIAYSGEDLNPWSLKYIGIPLNYLAVGIPYGGSTKLLYPILTVKNETTSAFQGAASSLVVIFWSYKILFGILSDCFPVFGLKRKPYIIAGWILCVVFLAALALMGNDVTPTNLVLMLTLANFAYVMADVAADGFVVWMAHREPIERRGRIQSLIYICREFAKILIFLVLLFGFSGPQIVCKGWQPGDKLCKRAVFGFSLTIPQYVWIMTAIVAATIPSYFFLYEDKVVREAFATKMKMFFQVLTKRAVWQVVLYKVVSNILFYISNPALDNTNNLWLGLSPFQKQLMNIFESLIFFTALNLIRSYCLHINWRHMVAAGACLQTFFMVLYLITVYNIWREPWFYIFTDVSSQFTSTLNFLAGVFYIVEVSEPGYEAITYSLITTAGNSVAPLASVVSNQFINYFPLLNDAADIKKDDMEVRNQYASLLFIVAAINLSSLFALPLLPPQKKQARELLARGETSKGWAIFTIVSVLILLVYSTTVTFITVAKGRPCSYLLGGSGCDGESRVPVQFLIAAVFMYAYGIIFYLGYYERLKARFFHTAAASKPVAGAAEEEDTTSTPNAAAI